MATTWNHTTCEVCWFGFLGRTAFPMELRREPGDLTVDTCCLCGSHKVTRIWFRREPDDPALVCGGSHEDDD